MTVEELEIVITAQNREFNSAITDVMGRINNLENRTARYGQSAQNVFKNLARVVSTAGIGKLLTDSVLSGGELEQNLGGAEVVFGNYADSMRKKAKSAYEDMGLSQSTYLATANKMGALFKGSGMDVSYAANMSQMAMQRAADVASIMGIDIKSAMESVTGAAKGNFTMMDNLGVAINETTLQIYAQEKGLGKLETTQQKVNAAMQMFLEKTEYAAGNYAKENDTFSGSLSTMKAELENLSAEIGTQLLPAGISMLSFARDGLQSVTPLITRFAGGLNTVAQYLAQMPSSAQAVLIAAVTAAVVIPKVSSVVDVLNMKIKTSTAWLVILTSVLAAIASVGAARREMDSQTGDDFAKTAIGADAAAESVDGLTDSIANLGSSGEAAKKSLADIDTLNVFSSSANTGGFDFAAVVEGAESASSAVSDVSGELAGLNAEMNSLDLNLDLSGLFTTTVSDVGLGISTMWNALFGEGDEQYQSLKAWNNSIKGLFGEEWTDFFQKAGSTIYKSMWGQPGERDEALATVSGWFSSVDEKVQGFFDMIGLGPFGNGWSEFWQGVGAALWDWINGDFTSGMSAIERRVKSAFDSWSQHYQSVGAQLYELTHSGEINMQSLGNKYNTLGADMNAAIVEYLKQGFSAEDALSSAKNDFLTTSEKIWYYENSGIAATLDQAEQWRKNLVNSGQIYSYAQYPTADYTSSAYSSAYTPNSLRDFKALESTAQKDQTITLNITNTLDGVAIGEFSAEYSARELARSNGY